MEAIFLKVVLDLDILNDYIDAQFFLTKIVRRSRRVGKSRIIS